MPGKGSELYREKGLQSVVAFVTEDVKRTLRMQAVKKGYTGLTKYASKVLTEKAKGKGAEE